MATVRSLAQIFEWFRKGTYPKEQHFQDAFYSFFHKEEKIPASSIKDLSETLNGKLDKDDAAAIVERIDTMAQDVGFYSEAIGGALRDLNEFEDRLNGMASVTAGGLIPLTVTGNSHMLVSGHSVTRETQDDIAITINSDYFADGADSAFLQVGAFTPTFIGTGITIHYGAGWEDVAPVADGITVYAFQRIGTRILVNRLTY